MYCTWRGTVSGMLPLNHILLTQSYATMAARAKHLFPRQKASRSKAATERTLLDLRTSQFIPADKKAKTLNQVITCLKKFCSLVLLHWLEESSFCVSGFSARFVFPRASEWRVLFMAVNVIDTTCCLSFVSAATVLLYAEVRWSIYLNCILDWKDKKVRFLFHHLLSLFKIMWACVTLLYRFSVLRKLAWFRFDPFAFVLVFLFECSKLCWILIAFPIFWPSSLFHRFLSNPGQVRKTHRPHFFSLPTVPPCPFGLLHGSGCVKYNSYSAVPLGSFFLPWFLIV